MATNEVDEFLNSAAGSSPAFKFKNIGDSVMGTIVRRSVVETDSLRKDEGKVKNLVLELETDHEYTQPVTNRRTGETTDVTGKNWSIWIKVGQLLTALSNALREEGAPPGSPNPGDRISVKFTSTEPASKPGYSPKKIYTVQYKQGAPDRSEAPTSVDDLL